MGAGRQRGKKVSTVWKVKEAGLEFTLKNWLGRMERPPLGDRFGPSAQEP